METAITKQDKYVAMFGYHRAMLQVAKGVGKLIKWQCGRERGAKDRD